MNFALCKSGPPMDSGGVVRTQDLVIFHAMLHATLQNLDPTVTNHVKLLVCGEICFAKVEPNYFLQYHRQCSWQSCMGGHTL